MHNVVWRLTFQGFMVPILLIVLGLCIFYALRRAKVRRLAAKQFSSVPPGAFTEWQTFELKSINIFLLASGWLLLAGPMIVYALPDDLSVIATVLYIAVFAVLIALAAIPGNRAEKLKKRYNIKY